ncbi:MAG: hypothetical protein OEV64_10200 [Desulfobulbaceae bacterium]|nr:hypothetical protein [Desulfobulbaceae bacterium]
MMEPGPFGIKNPAITDDYVFSGYCPTCKTIHHLSSGNAHRYALELMEELEKYGRVDFQKSQDEADSRFSTKYLFGPARGQMFGVLECLDELGMVRVLRAFSGQYNGKWNIEGWVEPLLDVPRFNSIVSPVDAEIKQLGRQIEVLEAGEHRNRLVARRRELSRRLMKEIHLLYRLRNFRNEIKLLTEFFQGSIPTGTGDCCGPKLLNHAAVHGLKPISLAEFYWGRENKSGSKQHGQFYPSCVEKCSPIIGYMLCGVEAMVGR